MKNIFKGSLKGYLCEECFESLSEVEVLLYHPYNREIIANSAVADAKETFHYVTEEEAKKRESLLIARTKTDIDGNFEFEIDDEFKYGAFDIDFVCGTVPPKPPVPRRNKPVQFHITTLVMQWRDSAEQDYSIYSWEHYISYKWWCFIRGYYFDAWVICGRLMNCKTNTPIANATVTAFDADFISDDNLGTVTTDSNGHFRIDYSSIQFKQTFLSPLINVETDPALPLTFQSGPDVYFKAELAGTNLVNETKANARKNVGYCLCVKLCSEVNVVNPEDPNFPSAWTGIGDTFNSVFGSGPEDFDTDGYAGAGKYALYSVIDLTGQAALKSAANRAIEYRFLISHVTTPNDMASPTIGDFTKIIGVTPNLFWPSKVIKLNKTSSDPSLPSIISVYSHQSDFDSDGWFDANKSIDRTLISIGLTPGDLGSYQIIEEDPLISLDTRALTTALSVPDSAANAGEAIPNGNTISIEKIAIRFEIRESVTNNPIPGNGRTLNSIVINNNPVFMKLAIKELEDTTLCSPISGDVHAKYTVYHPHLAASATTLEIKKNSVPTWENVSIAPLLDGDGNPSVDEVVKNLLKLNNPPTLGRCTYALRLRSVPRLHNGKSSYPTQEAPIQTFFYEG
ncbi:transthyretin-like family protein [Flavobacterium amniphilum]|uniref:transthyretin-like family protein n=1 Tax=Flavobacterium amniphilum TaxID=1834035 RepID=UPI00202A3515|nr:transthyretin-like family protein [Flavobacterium amniphilum]MCL9804641.1 transthyretin-like family protein [Flavobacterium amniphilum]